MNRITVLNHFNIIRKLEVTGKLSAQGPDVSPYIKTTVRNTNNAQLWKHFETGGINYCTNVTERNM